VRFEVLTLIQVGVPPASNLRLEPTCLKQRHFTLAWDDLDEGWHGSLLASTRPGHPTTPQPHQECAG
jgi:hypothetical protein